MFEVFFFVNNFHRVNRRKWIRELIQQNILCLSVPTFFYKQFASGPRIRDYLTSVITYHLFQLIYEFKRIIISTFRSVGDKYVCIRVFSKLN